MKQALREFSLPLNTVFLYVDHAVTYIVGYIYWFVITKLAGADVLGTVGTAVSFANLLFTLLGVNIHVGALRFLGKAYAQRQKKEFSTFFISSLIPIVVSSLFGVALVLLLRGWLQTLTGLPFTFLWLACLIAFFAVVSYLFRATFISIMRIQIITLGAVLAGVAKLGVGITLVLLGWGALGAGIGYSITFVISFSLLLGFLMWGPIPLTQSMGAFNLRAAREIVKAGSAGWVPAVILAIGSQFGTLIVYGTWGAGETGLYYLAFAIFSAVSAIPSSIWVIMFPVLSGMPDGRKRFTWRGIKFGLAITVPLVTSLFLSSKVILGLFGSEFLLVDRALALFLASAVFFTIVNGIETLAYAYGRYWYVLVIGLATNIPRVLLYIALVPLYGANGAAIAFLGGIVIGFICSSIIALRMGMQLFWKQVLLILSLPIGSGAVVYLLQLHWTLGILLVFVVSLLGYIRLKIITRGEMREIIHSLYLEPLLRKTWPFEELLRKR